MQNSADKREKTAYDHIVKYTGLFGGIQGISLLAAIVRNKVVAELLGPIGMGIISLYNHTGSLLNNATNFGISFSAVRHIAELTKVVTKSNCISLSRRYVFGVWPLPCWVFLSVACFLPF